MLFEKFTNENQSIPFHCRIYITVFAGKQGSSDIYADLTVQQCFLCNDQDNQCYPRAITWSKEMQLSQSKSFRTLDHFNIFQQNSAKECLSTGIKPLLRTMLSTFQLGMHRIYVKNFCFDKPTSIYRRHLQREIPCCRCRA